jgi:quinol monooxygenase YgiN
MLLSSGYYITAELKVKDESNVQTAKESLLVLCQETLTEPGCSLFTLHHDSKCPTRFLLWERFDDEAAFKAHFEAKHTKEYVAKDLTEVVQYFQTDVLG